MNLGQTRVRLVKAGAVFAAVALVAGCGSQYRPVITPINPSGPPAQPNSLAIVVSAPSPTTPGIATVVDYSGDTIVATAPIGPGPTSFTLDENGSTGYTVNSDGTLTNFPASTSLQAKNVNYSTLPNVLEHASQPVSLFSPQAGLWVADQCSFNLITNLCESAIDVLTGGPETYKLSIPVAPTPVAIIGPGIGGQRYYSISVNNSATPAGSILPYSDMTCNTAPSTVDQNGEADAIEITSHTVSYQIPLGKCPVYGLIGSSGQRLFVLNRGSDTVSVINTAKGQLDSCIPFLNQAGQTVTCHPSLPLSTTAGLPQDANSNVPAVAGPVYAEFNAFTNKIVVADYDGGTISIIDVSLDEWGNDYNTYDSSGNITGGFGTTYTVKVGQDPAIVPYPASVTVLQDGSRAYTANQGESTVTIVNLTSHTVEKTLPGITGHPRTVVSTANSLYGKVYVASPDSNVLTIIRTDQDIVGATVGNIVGNIVDVRVSSQDGNKGNNNTTSRLPGGGQPCYLPPGSPGLPATLTLAACQTLP